MSPVPMIISNAEHMSVQITVVIPPVIVNMAASDRTKKRLAHRSQSKNC